MFIDVKIELQIALLTHCIARAHLQAQQPHSAHATSRDAQKPILATPLWGYQANYRAKYVVVVAEHHNRQEKKKKKGGTRSRS